MAVGTGHSSATPGARSHDLNRDARARGTRSHTCSGTRLETAGKTDGHPEADEQPPTLLSATQTCSAPSLAPRVPADQSPGTPVADGQRGGLSVLPMPQTPAPSRSPAWGSLSTGPTPNSCEKPAFLLGALLPTGLERGQQVLWKWLLGGRSVPGEQRCRQGCEASRRGWARLQAVPDAAARVGRSGWRRADAWDRAAGQ